MKILVLGTGLQGKAVLHDLENSPRVKQIIAGDIDQDDLQAEIQRRGYRKTTCVELNVTHESSIRELLKSTAPDAVICMVPPALGFGVARAAVDAGVHYISTSYAGRLSELHGRAVEQDITVLPEMGLDPGIDLLLGRIAVDVLDEVFSMNSYGGGIPAPECNNCNPLRYKITWTFDGVLKAYQRPGKMLKNGMVVDVAGADIFREENCHSITVPGLGEFEAYANGDALKFIPVYDLGASLQEMGRYAIRWPGHIRFWQLLKELGYFDDKQKAGLNISPRQFLISHLEPQLQFTADERDMTILMVVCTGLKDGRETRVVCSALDYRDPESGLFAMNRTVGYTASVGAQMVLTGEIPKRGVLSPARDVPALKVMAELEKRGMPFQISTARI